MLEIPGFISRGNHHDDPGEYRQQKLQRAAKRAAARKRDGREGRRRRRAARGAVTRAEYLASHLNSEHRCKPWQVVGISRRWYYVLKRRECTGFADNSSKAVNRFVDPSKIPKKPALSIPQSKLNDKNCGRVIRSPELTCALTVSDSRQQAYHGSILPHPLRRRAKAHKPPAMSNPSFRTTRTAGEILHRLGTEITDTRIGRHYSRCPECSHHRSRKGQRRKCLSVLIDGQGVRWRCHHCGWRGGELYGSARA
jgi:hypothetical protein